MGDTKPFDAEIAEFLAHKRILGFKYGREETTLRRFQRFCEQRAFTGGVLTRDLVEAWCEQWPTDPDERESKIRSSVVRQFALYLTSTGRDAHIPMNQAHNHSRHSRYEAYVFTDDEIARILDASDRVYPHPNSNAHLVMPVLIRLLYSSGPRIRETLGIKLADVDTGAGVIKLTAAKNGKHRLIPLSETMAQVVGDYTEMAHPRPAGEDFLFKNPSGKPFGHAHIYQKFREVLIAAGIPHGGRGAGPRIHDLRHTFCCHTLRKAARGGTDMRAFLPVLAEYLGHESIVATSQYLKMTSEVHPDIRELVDRACSDVIPAAKP